MPRELWTVGFSTRTLEEFVGLLQAYRISFLVDVRTIPRSRHTPQFNRASLEGVLPAVGIQYHHLPQLGGLRHGLGKASPNSGWRNAAFRGFADYMLTPDFHEGLKELEAIRRRRRTVIACAEALYWRCHRSLIADALMARGVPVSHILGARKCEPHRLTAFARVEGERITYPGLPLSP